MRKSAKPPRGGHASATMYGRCPIIATFVRALTGNRASRIRKFLPHFACPRAQAAVRAESDRQSPSPVHWLTGIAWPRAKGGTGRAKRSALAPAS